MAARNVAAQVDWTKIYSSLGLGKATLSELSAFRARHSAALNKSASLSTSMPQIDLAHYKAVLKDKRALEQVEKVLKEFKPVTYDLSKWNSAVEAFEGKAVDAAKATVQKVSAEESSLQATLSNIKDARPFEELTVSEVNAARPEIQKAVETMVKKGKWSVPGYREKFGEFSLM